MARVPSERFGIAEAQIVALFMECIVYGIFLVTFFLCMRVLLFTADRMTLKRASDIKWIMVVVAFLMGLFATLDVAFGLRHNLDAFIYFSGPPEEEFHDINYWVNIMKTVDFVAQTAIGDAILISRCHMVYNRRWLIIVLPVALWIMVIVSGCMMIWGESTSRHEALLTDPRITPWLDTLTACTLVVNVLVTSLIVWRIWSVRSKVTAVSSAPHRLSKIMRIILDSGLIYTFVVVIFFGTTLAGSNAQYGVSDVVVQVIGITFNLIIIRVHNGSAAEIEFSTTGHVPSFPLRFVHTTATLDPQSFTGPAEVGVEVEVDTRIDTEQEDSWHKDPWKHDSGVAV